ncbi:peptidoglycan hydrolase [Lysinibacillus sp. KCTC 33748]|uniref:DsbA family oxidoreductase n=1 Tax=unclassified Lysinibacillus TaxID=2636778 RepID=UPI0009A8E066|nr:MULTISPECIES: DsbA family oxidoreductase [unclassified Lysinibacillus]OXS72893.1 peptidoglycan hydrolase [Lysinibacillus sp. KCTC 33748]SKB90414.1 Predicted dithiol-disulfide isomerase, DsbA family [Lysinibacillus sp. AC-3]
MKIEIFSDFTCPFCYIGKRELERAIDSAGYVGQVEIEYKAYQIGPDTPKIDAPTVYGGMAEKFDSSIEEVKELTKGIAKRAKEVGLHYNFDDMKTAHTEKAHRLAKWTRQFGKESVYTEELMNGYFTEGKDLNDDMFLLKVIENINLDVEIAKGILASTDFSEALDRDRYDAQQLGVESVPFFVFENRYGIKGAEPNEVFVRTLHQAAEIAGIRPVLKMVGDGEAICVGGECKL